MPAQVVCLTAGVDIQLDRIELEIVGWGKGEESWSLDYVSLPGTPSEKEVWQRLDQLLMRRLPHPVLGSIPIAAACIDSGNWSSAVYNFCGPRFHRKVFAIKGHSDPKTMIWPRRPSRPKDGRVSNLFSVGVTAAKEIIHQRLKIEIPGIGFCHFPDDRDFEYFEQLLAEKPIRKKVGNDFKRVWVKPAFARNEALDARVYAFSALHALKSYGFNLDREVERVAALAAKPSAPKKTMSDFGRLNT